MLTLKRRSEPVVTAAPQQYAVVMLDEEQVSKLVGNTPMRRVNSAPHAYDPHASYVRLRRRLVAGVTLIAVLSTGAAAWRWAPRPAFAAVFPWSKPAPTVATAASFSVAVTAPPSADAAERVAAQLRGLALPVFTRRRPNTNGLQVMVGPYVSLDEAEAAQRLLRTRGYGSGRVFVDESVRNAPRNDAWAAAGAARPGVLLVGASDRLSLVLELENQPRRVAANRVDPTMFEVEMGPVRGEMARQQWSAPAGVHLLRHVTVAEAGAGAGASRYVKARIAVPEFSQASVRVDGRRVYVDLTWPQHGGDGLAAPAPPRVHTKPAPVENPADAPADSRSPDPGAYRELVAPSLARFEEMTPFLLSAARSPSPAVLSALTETLKSLEGTLRAIEAPPEAADGHSLIRSAAAAARTAMAADFAGDRTAQAQQAVNMFLGGKAALP